MTRAQIEAVLQEHKLGGRPSCVHFGHDIDSPCPSLINDLLALAPTPSREELEKIIYPNREFYDEKSRQIQEVILDELMAWATGQPTTTQWCSHLTWKDLKDGGYWLYKYPLEHKYALNISYRPIETWDICPVKGCHAKRPEGT